MTGNLLLPEQPIAVLPQLACAVGLNEAIFLQQLHFWLINSNRATKYGRLKDDAIWVYNTAEEWREKSFPFWSESTIRRAISSLETQQCIITEIEKSPSVPGGRRKWFTVNYEIVNKLGSVQNEQTGISNLNTRSVQNEQAIYIDSETTTETTAEEEAIPAWMLESPADETEKTGENPPPPSEVEPDTSPELAGVCTAYENNIAMLTPVMRDKLIMAVDEYPAEWIVSAIGEAVEHNKRSWAYVAAILRRWKTEGPKVKTPSNGKLTRPAMQLSPPDPNCSICGGMGIVQSPAKVGEPGYGETVVCECRKIEAVEGVA